KLEFLRQQFVHTSIGLVAAVNEVYYHHIVLLPVTVTASDALFDTLRVPGQVIVDNQRTELKVDTLCSGLGGNHDGAAVLEVLDQRSARVGGLGAGDSVSALVKLEPVLIDGLRA